MWFCATPIISTSLKTFVVLFLFLMISSRVIFFLKVDMMYKFRTWVARYLSVIIYLALLGIICSCNPTVHFPPDVHIDFSSVDFMQGINYNVSHDELDIWLTTKQLNQKGRECLPGNLSVQNLYSPEVCDISVFPPTYVKGRPLMALYVKNVSQIKENEFIEFDLFQKNIKKQTIRISVDFDNTSNVAVIINGKRIVANRAR